MDSHLAPIVVIKLGGSLICDKTRPFSVRSEAIHNLALQIAEFARQSSDPIMIVHGGGSFGHPLAKKYLIHKGINSKIDQQIPGLLETHEAMKKLNSYILNALREVNLLPYPISPSSFFIQEENVLSAPNFALLPEIMAHRIIPVMFGDILFIRPKNFGILSGDTIIRHLCERFGGHAIRKVIFATDQEGIYGFGGDPTTPDLIHEISGVNFLKLGFDFNNRQNRNSIDVTGGMEKKVEEIKNIIRLGICVEIINGLKSQNLCESLNNTKCVGTKIVPPFS
jgi:isopentenyl phosphate kinase